MTRPGLADFAAAAARRVEAEKARVPAADLAAAAQAAPRPRDFIAALSGPGPAVIAEVKLASPSEGALGCLDPARLAREYAANGAAAVSVLTEPDFFKGGLMHLAAARAATAKPLLMKDFVLDEYQLLQARAFGADCVLLMAALLHGRLPGMLARARALGLAALVEAHDETELKAARDAGARLIGVNNRDLRTLEVDLGVSRRLAPLARETGAVLVCESGIASRGQVEELFALGYKAFLVGTHLIRSGRPGRALAELIGGRNEAP